MLQVVLLSPDEVANKAIILLKDIYTNLGPRLQQNQVEIHDDFIQSCVDRLKALYDTVSEFVCFIAFSQCLALVKIHAKQISGTGKIVLEK